MTIKYVTHEQMQELKRLLALSDDLRDQSKSPSLTLVQKLALRRAADAAYSQAQDIQ